ncbi:hypothetical protein MaudCBS49596_004898 [Microsporum audouinii]
MGVDEENGATVRRTGQKTARQTPTPVRVNLTSANTQTGQEDRYHAPRRSGRRLRGDHADGFFLHFALEAPSAQSTWRFFAFLSGNGCVLDPGKE